MTWLKRLELTILVCMCMSASASVRAWDFELTAAANHTNFDEHEERNGLSLRARGLFYSGSGWSKGLFVNANFPGIHPLAVDLFGGYGLRSTGSSYFELGAGLRYSQIWGIGYGLLIGFGANLGSGMYISLPLIFKSNTGFEVTPYLGFNF